MDLLTNSSVNNQQLSNICRCCFAEGCYKDITSEYYVSDRKEVYEQMLKDTFDIQISHNVGQSNNVTRYICDKCITRLRDAYDFKTMVQQNEEKINNIAKLFDLGSSSKDIDTSQIKIEDIKEEFDDDMNCDDDGDEDDGDEDESDDDEDDDPCNYDSNEHDIIKLPELVTTSANGSVELKDGLQRRPSTDTATKGHNVGENAEKLNNKSKSKDWTKILERRGNGPLLRENSIKLISNSTICVFQWNKSQYRCFCCTEPFSDMKELRDHTNTSHTIENIEKKIIIQQNRLVKVEISVLLCKICGSSLEDLSSLKDHLKSHDIKFELDEDLLVPFRIEGNNLQCQICCQKFTLFRLLNIHMNKHYQKQVCHICGAAFSNLVFLNLHKSRSHRPLVCKECDVTFKSKTEKKEHDVSVHNLKVSRKLRFPCPYCQQRFYQENFRVQHLVDKHGLKKPEHKCNICSKVFITRSLCNNHVRKVHMKEKNQECDICHHLFYTKSDVLRHKVTHTGEKKYSCSLCSNLFSTKDSLRRHLKRSHAGAT